MIDNIYISIINYIYTYTYIYIYVSIPLPPSRHDDGPSLHLPGCLKKSCGRPRCGAAVGDTCSALGVSAAKTKASVSVGSMVVSGSLNRW